MGGLFCFPHLRVRFFYRKVSFPRWVSCVRQVAETPLTENEEMTNDEE